MQKPTNKERDQQIQMLTTQMSQIHRLLGAYVEYKGDGVDFQKHLIDLHEEMKKKAKNDTTTDTKASNKADNKAV